MSICWRTGGVYDISMQPLLSLMLLPCLVVCGCAALAGRGAEYRHEFEERKQAILAASDAQSEAEAMRELGAWFAKRPYGYTLRPASQPGANGVDLARLQPGEAVELRVYKKYDDEPTEAGFTFIPKDKVNLLLLRAN